MADTSTTAPAADWETPRICVMVVGPYIWCGAVSAAFLRTNLTSWWLLKRSVCQKAFAARTVWIWMSS